MNKKYNTEEERKAAQKARCAKYYQQNKEKILARQTEYNQQNRVTQQQRTNEVYTLHINDKMATTNFGTVNKKNPLVVYLSLGCWIYPDTTDNHNKQYLIGLEDTVRRLIKTNLLFDGLFAQRFLLDYDVCLDPFRNGRKRYLAVDLYLKQNSTTILSMKELLPTVTERTTRLVDAVVDELEDNDFTVSKTKN